MTWRGSAKRSGTKSLLRCVQTWWPTTRNVWPLWLPTRVFALIISLSVGKRTKSAGDQIIFFPTVYKCVNCLLIFLISLPINAIILFIQTDSWTQNVQEHKRWDLSHEPITAEHNQSYPIILRWRHFLLSHDFPPFIFNCPPPNPTAGFRGSVKTQWAQGRRETWTPAVTLPAWCRCCTDLL